MEELNKKVELHGDIEDLWAVEIALGFEDWGECTWEQRLAGAGGGRGEEGGVEEGGLKVVEHCT